MSKLVKCEGCAFDAFDHLCWLCLVAALVTRAICQLVIWMHQRDRVRPRRLSSRGQVRVLEIFGDLRHELDGGVGVVDVINRPQELGWRG